MAVTVDNFNPDSFTDTATWNVEFMLLCIILSTCLSSFGLRYLTTTHLSVLCLPVYSAWLVVFRWLQVSFECVKKLAFVQRLNVLLNISVASFSQAFRHITLSYVLTLLIGQRSPLLFAILAFFCSLIFNVCILLSVLWCCWLHDRKDPVCKNCTSEQPNIG